ncbi:NirD/YgiW/YdeI family stress tolerance protein [Acinetobacter pragensis]|uniref:NirD/YgiW/YdeI family stress tolerance protein n=1 Tax=Acinetobacter pragensis TaxID=1806892 RepID=UPI00333EFDC2
MMKLKTACIMGSLMAVVSASALAYDAEDQHIITAGGKNPVTVAQAAKAADETAVSVTGVIVREIKPEHYELKDKSGTITVEIDRDLVVPAKLKPGTKVRVYGEVDTHRIKPTDIEAVKVDLL